MYYYKRNKCKQHEYKTIESINFMYSPFEPGVKAPLKLADPVKSFRVFKKNMRKLFKRSINNCADGESFYWPKHQRSLAYIYAAKYGVIIQTKAVPDDKESVYIIRLGLKESQEQNII